MDCSPPGFSVRGDPLGKNTGVGCHALLQGIFPTQGSNPVLLHCRWFFTDWASREAHFTIYMCVCVCLCVCIRTHKYQVTLLSTWNKYNVVCKNICCSLKSRSVWWCKHGLKRRWFGLGIPPSPTDPQQSWNRCSRSPDWHDWALQCKIPAPSAPQKRLQGMKPLGEMPGGWWWSLGDDALGENR